MSFVFKPQYFKMFIKFEAFDKLLIKRKTKGKEGKVLFSMFSVNQKLRLERFQMCSVGRFFIYFSGFRQNRAVSRNLNHYWRTKFPRKNCQTLSDIMSLEFSVSLSKFNSPQVKRYLISNREDLVCKLPCELPNDVRPMIFGN